MATNKLLCLENAGSQISMFSTLNEKSAPIAIEKNQNSVGRFGATSQTALPIQPIYHKNEPNGLDWQCCLAGGSKMAPWILIAVGVRPLF